MPNDDTSEGTAPTLRPRVKVWFESETGFGFGQGLVSILQAVEHTGSIKAAAVELGQSYRHVWGRLKRAEVALGVELVASQIGGQGSKRSGLTAAGLRLVSDYNRVRDRLIDLADEEFVARPPEHDGEVASRGPIP